MFGRKRKISKRIAEAQQRLDRLRTADLYEWAEQCQYVFGKTMLDSRRADSPAQAGNMLEEAIMAAEISRLIAEEAQRRLAVR